MSWGQSTSVFLDDQFFSPNKLVPKVSGFFKKYFLVEG